MAKNKYQKGISANILLLGIVSLLNDLSSEMILPILPLFITRITREYLKYSEGSFRVLV
jgi:hypothetical protein